MFPILAPLLNQNMLPPAAHLHFFDYCWGWQCVQFFICNYLLPNYIFSSLSCQPRVFAHFSLRIPVSFLLVSVSILWIEGHDSNIFGHVFVFIVHLWLFVFHREKIHMCVEIKKILRGQFMNFFPQGFFFYCFYTWKGRTYPESTQAAASICSSKFIHDFTHG